MTKSATPTMPRSITSSSPTMSTIKITTELPSIASVVNLKTVFYDFFTTEKVKVVDLVEPRSNTNPK